MLLLAGMNIGPIQAYRGHPGSVGLVAVLAPILVGLAIWMLRTAEIGRFRAVGGAGGGVAG